MTFDTRVGIIVYMIHLYVANEPAAGERFPHARLRSRAHRMLAEALKEACARGELAWPAGWGNTSGDGEETAIEAALATTPQGKPYLPACPAVSFSYSHTARTVALAFSADLSGAALGLDVADHRGKDLSTLLALSRRFFAPGEHALLSSCPEAEVAPLFYRLWAAKEAYVKYTGHGMAEDFRSFTADLRDGVIRPEANTTAEAVAYLYELSAVLPEHAICLCAGTPLTARDVTLHPVNRYNTR